VAAFEDLCRRLFDAADERFLILEEELLLNAHSLDRQYVLTCTMADEREGPWEGTVEVTVGSDAANSAAAMFEDVFDEQGQQLQAAWEVTVTWHGPAISEAGAGQDAGPDVARAAGVDADQVSVRLASEWDGSAWIHRPSYRYSLWLADDEDPEEDAARIMAIAEDGLDRLQSLAKSWPIVEPPAEAGSEDDAG
jgi:hypothetical protein